jgi:hypothetical protein
VFGFECERISYFNSTDVVSFINRSFAVDGTMGWETRLPRHNHINYWIFLPKCLLWVLLLSAATKSILDYGGLTTGLN